MTMDQEARHLDALARAADHAATAEAAEAVARQADATAKAHARAVGLDRTVEDHARATGQNPAGYVVLTPGSPEHAEAERTLTRARAL